MLRNVRNVKCIKSCNMLTGEKISRSCLYSKKIESKPISVTIRTYGVSRRATIQQRSYPYVYYNKHVFFLCYFCCVILRFCRF